MPNPLDYGIPDPGEENRPRGCLIASMVIGAILMIVLGYFVMQPPKPVTTPARTISQPRPATAPAASQPRAQNSPAE